MKKLIAYTLCSLQLIIAPSTIAEDGSAGTAPKVDSTLTTAPTVPPNPNKNVDTKDQVKPSTWKYQNEEHALVDKVGSNIAEILEFAWSKNTQAKTDPAAIEFLTKELSHSENKYQFTGKFKGASTPIEFEFALKDYIWSPDNYAPFASALLSKTEMQAGAATTIPPTFLQNATDAYMSCVLEENERVSKALSATPLDPCLHEQAAFLQTVFGLRDFAGSYSDTRIALNKIAAHLAIAKALRGGQKKSIAATLAEVGLQSMSCRDGIAVAMARELLKTEKEPKAASVLRAVIIRGTGDYRLFKRENFTGLEETQFGMRYAFHFDGKAVLDYVSKYRVGPDISWKRIGSLAYQTVESGRAFQETFLEDEVEDFLNDYKYFHHKPLVNITDITAELNRTPQGSLMKQPDGTYTLQAISWNDIAYSHQRYICLGFARQYRLLNNFLGLQDDAKALLKKSDRDLSQLRLWCFALNACMLEDPMQKEYIFSKGSLVVKDTPELATNNFWSWYKQDVEQYFPDRATISPKLWFDPISPFGTAFNRGNLGRRSEKPDSLAELDALKKISPYDPFLIREWIEAKYHLSTGGRATAEQLKEAYGAMAEFNKNVMAEVVDAQRGDPAKYEAAMNTLAQKDPSKYLELAEYFVVHNQPDKAAKYYDLGLFKSRDSVNSANKSWRYIYYLFNKGEIAKCYAIAVLAYRAYSHRGLLCMARLLELMHRFEAAEHVYSEIGQRYNSYADQCAFYLRNKDQDPNYALRAQQLMKRICPDGLQKVVLTDFKTPPDRGIVAEEHDKASGLKLNDIIVAFDGYRTDNEKTLYLVSSLSFTKPFKKVIIWNGTEYKELNIRTFSQKGSGSSWFAGDNYVPGKPALKVAVHEYDE